MKHFYGGLEGYFDYQDIYQKVVSNAKEGEHFVEIGSFLGKSGSFMAVEIINSQKDIRFDCIDHWRGSEEHKELDIIDNMFDIYLKNIEPVKHIVNPIREDRSEASKLYEDESIDFIFVDAAHDFNSVTTDLMCWWPKLKKNGIIGGDDLPHPPVASAVNSFFKDKNVKINSTYRHWLIDLSDKGIMW